MSTPQQGKIDNEQGQCSISGPAERSDTVYLITLNWRRGPDTLTCLESMAAQTHTRRRLLVVDNGSGDDSVKVIRSQFPDAEVMESPHNLGFAGGANLGLRHALSQGADWIFLANNDTWLAPDALEQLLRHARPDVGLLAPIIYYAAESKRIWSAGGRVHPWTTEIVGDVRDQVDDGQWREPVERDFVTGCGMLLTRQFLETVGLFDERFFMYYEDADLCRRARQAGIRILLVPAAKMWHKVALSSGGGDSSNERYWMARSSILYFRKHLRGAQWLAAVPWRIGSAGKTSFRLLQRGRHRACAAYWRGLYDGWRLGSPC